MHFVRTPRPHRASLLSRLPGLLCLLTFCLWSPSLLAQGSKEQMQTVSNEAMEKFQRNEFEAAAKGFEQAYGIYPEDVLLKNATIAWFSGGVCEEAERTGIAPAPCTCMKREMRRIRPPLDRSNASRPLKRKTRLLIMYCDDPIWEVAGSISTFAMRPSSCPGNCS